MVVSGQRGTGPRAGPMAEAHMFGKKLVGVLILASSVAVGCAKEEAPEPTAADEAAEEASAALGNLMGNAEEAAEDAADE